LFPERIYAEQTQPVRLAMLEFPIMDQVRRWDHSEQYRERKRLRLAATVSNGFFMTGP
jgi:uncharacterized protein (DUF1330 family)